MSETVVTEADLDAPPEKVWRALTEPALLAEWLAPSDVSGEEGARFSIDAMAETGPVECEVIEADPPHELRVRWRGGEARPGAPDSEVAFRLTPTERGGTLLRVVHSGIPSLVIAPANDAEPVMTMMLRAA
jgi:uncharacterized protein YndB with AHSA1/START domain